MIGVLVFPDMPSGQYTLRANLAATPETVLAEQTVTVTTDQPTAILFREGAPPSPTPAGPSAAPGLSAAGPSRLAALAAGPG